MAKTDIIELLTDYFHREKIHNVVILTDRNVDQHYPDYFSGLSEHVRLDKLVISPGEKTKSIQTATDIWDYFAKKQYDRSVFLLNFGGGMVTDLGGYVASSYKRGIRYANCPTTLLAMIDAAIGGKNGVNLPCMKNAVGTFYFSDIQLPVDLSLLSTLPKEEFLSGFGEFVKYALIGSSDLFQSLLNRETFPSLTQEEVNFCIEYKTRIIQEDPFDRGLRHILNFGHTIGHAVEGWCASQGAPMAHGIAVANGLYYESLLSMRFGRLPKEELQQIVDFLPKHFQIVKITPPVFEQLLPYLQNDKKNCNGNINFTFLEHIGHAIPDHAITTNNLSTFFDYITI